VHVLGVPRLAGGTVTDDRNAVDLAAYPWLASALAVLDRIGTRLYTDAVIPMALAHQYASLPIGIGSEVLRTHAQRGLAIASPLMSAHRPTRP
jgi:hypothetical protein